MQLNLFGVTEVQTSTCQVPCGDHSIFAALEKTSETDPVTAAESVVYLKINEFSNWETGQSHAVSYTRLAKETGMKRSQVVACINALIAKGWLKKNVRDGQNTANTYQVIHHQCEPHETPIDKDGFPQKCAIPRGEGSPFTLLADGRINWREFLYWVITKVHSDWTTGIIAMTIAQVRELVGFSVKTICKIRKSLARVGLLEKLSKPYRTFVCQLFPKPYPKRRRRRRQNPKGMRRDSEFYYSFNGLWRISHKTGDIQAKIDGPGDKWRFAEERELERVNAKVHKDFMPIRDIAISPIYRSLSEQSA